MTGAQIGAEADALDKAMNELRAAYELYFMGVEPTEPLQARDRLKAKLRWLQGQQVRNTAQRFRINQLKARMISLENYWQRVLRQREAGTYHRDHARVKRLEAARRKQEARAEALRAEAQAQVQAQQQGAQPAAGQPGAAQPSVAQPGAPVRRQRPRVRSAEELTEDTLQRLYRTYATARKRCGEGMDLGYSDMARTLRAQVPKILSKSGARAVEFKVVIRNNHAVLKAVPRDD